MAGYCIDCHSRVCAHVAPPPLPPGRVLSRREQQLLDCLGRGLANKEIADELGIADGTVKVYMSLLFRKLGVSSRFEAALWALHNFLGGSKDENAVPTLP